MTEEHQAGQGVPVAPQPQAEPPMPRSVRTWLMTLSIIVGVQLLLVVAAALAGMFVWWGSYGALGGYDDSFNNMETVATEIEMLVQDGDVEGYMDLYGADDSSYDADEVRDDFEKTTASFDASATMPVDYSVDSAMLYEDEETGETIAEMMLTAYDWNTGNMIGRRMVVWVLYDELPEVVLTGKEGRELGNAETLW